MLVLLDDEQRLL